MPVSRRSKVKPVLQEHKSTRKVMRQFFSSGEPDSDEEVLEESDVHVFVTEPAYIRVSHGMTINMGNYQSLRVDVAVTLPCYVEDVDVQRQRISDYVADSLEGEIALYQGDKE